MAVLSPYEFANHPGIRRPLNELTLVYPPSHASPAALFRSIPRARFVRRLRQEFQANVRFAAIVFASLALVGVVAHVTYSVRLFARETAMELYLIGTELVDGRDYVKAIQTLHRAAYLDPSDAGIYVELGNAYYYAGSDSEAAVAWDHAIRLDPELRHGRMAAGLPRPVKTGVPPPPAAVHANPDEVWKRSWSLTLGGFSRSPRKPSAGSLVGLQRCGSDGLSIELSPCCDVTPTEIGER
jgi:tetratricopeptide (TPR) repeat protein